MPTVEFNAPGISPFKYDPLNIFYIMAWLVFGEVRNSSHLRKRKAEDILITLRSDYGIYIPEYYDNISLLKCCNQGLREAVSEDGIELYKEIVDKFFRDIHVDLKKEINLQQSYNSFIEKTKSRIDRFTLMTSVADLKACFKARKGIVISTIHAIKGEEYNSVIGISLLNGIIPHWDYIFNKDMSNRRCEDTNKLLYVLISLSKKNVYLISEQGRKTRKKKEYIPTDELIKNSFCYDSY